MIHNKVTFRVSKANRTYLQSIPRGQVSGYINTALERDRNRAELDRLLMDIKMELKKLADRIANGPISINSDTQEKSLPSDIVGESIEDLSNVLDTYFHSNGGSHA